MTVSLNSSVISNRFISGQTDFIEGSEVVTAGISSDGYKYHAFTSQEHLLDWWKQ